MNKSNLSTLRSEVKDVFVVDVLKYVYRLNDVLLSMLLKPEPGVYMPKQIHPLIDLSKSNDRFALFDSRLVEITAGDIFTDINDPLKRSAVINSNPGDIWLLSESTGKTSKSDSLPNKLLLPRRLYESYRPRALSLPDIPAMGCRMAIAVTLEYLNTLNRHVKVFIGSQYKLPNILDHEHFHALDNEIYETEFDDLQNQVAKFVNGDVWNMYNYSVEGTALIIKKGIDFRAYDWHRLQLEKDPSYDATSDTFHSDSV